MSADNFLDVEVFEPGVWFKDSEAWVLSEGRLSYPNGPRHLRLVARSSEQVEAYINALLNSGYYVEY